MGALGRRRLDRPSSVPVSRTVSIAVGTSSGIRVSHGSDSPEIPFSLHFAGSEEDRHPGMQMASAYSSRSILDDSSRGVAREHVVSTNNTLDRGGYRYFQSGCDRHEAAGRELSIFAVGGDHGIPVGNADARANGTPAVAAGILEARRRNPGRVPSAIEFLRLSCGRTPAISEKNSPINA